MFKIGQQFTSRSRPDLVGVMTIIDLSEDMQWVKFTCTFCNRIHEVETDYFETLIVK